MAKTKKPVKKSAAKKPAKKVATKKPVKKVVAKKPGQKAKVVAKKAARKVEVKVKTKSSTAKSLQNFLTPLDDRLIVEVAAGEKRTAGGLYIPDTAAVTGQFRGTVVAAGRGHRDGKGRLRPMDVKSGDTVLFAEFSGSKISLMGNDYQMLRESEILGIVEKG